MRLLKKAIVVTKPGLRFNPLVDDGPVVVFRVLDDHKDDLIVYSQTKEICDIIIASDFKVGDEIMIYGSMAVYGMNDVAFVPKMIGPDITDDLESHNCDCIYCER